MLMRGLRGATTADANTRESILAATHELLSLMIEANHLCAEDVASVIFTTTPDLNADYPALAARALGWHDVALMCAHEMNVPHGLPMCIRILIHWNTPLTAHEVQHVYIKGAARLRPDRSFSLPHPPAPSPKIEKMISGEGGQPLPSPENGCCSQEKGRG